MKNSILFYLFFINGILFAQNPHYFVIDKTKGLPSNTIYDIQQDKKGMLWLATNEGISSFDGRKFTSFTSNVQESKSGSNLVEDIYGRIWYCSFDGSIYYVINGILNSLPQQKPLGYQKFSILNNSFIYFEENKIVFLDLKTLKQTKTIPFATDKLIATHNFKNIYYLYTAEYIYEIKDNYSFKKIKVPENIKKNFNVSIITNTKDKLLFISKYSNNYCLYSNGVFKEYEFHKNINFKQNIAYASTKNWICTTTGIVEIDIKNPAITKPYFEDYNISSILYDKEGNHWIGTLGKGLLLVPNFDTYLIPTANSPSKLKSYNKKIIYSTNNDKIYSSVNSKNLFDFKEIYSGKSNHTIDQFEIDTLSQKIYFTSNTFKVINLNGKETKNVIIATKDIIPIDSSYYAYAATGTCGLIRVSERKSEWDSIFNTSKLKVTSDSQFTGLVDNVRGKSVAHNLVNNTIYFATNTGLFAFNKNKKTIVLWNEKPINLIKIVYFNSKIYGLTSKNKLISIDKNNQIKLINFSLGENLIQKIKLINSSLYLFTNNSILKYNLDQNTFSKVFNRNTENEISDIIESGKHYLLASTKGLIRVDANDLKPNCIPKFLLQNILVNGKKTAIKKLETLNSKQNSIEIQFSVISFVPNLENILYYRINNDKWQNIDDNSRSLKLSSLASGSYKIQFKTFYNNKFSEIQTISISIQKPFIESVWFYILTTLFIILIIHFSYRHQIKKIKRRNQLLLDKIELEKNLNQSTLKAIKSQMNPHFFYNALNTIQSYILANDKKQAVNYLSKFSSLTRTILEMSEKETISVAEEIQTLSFYLDIEKARFDEDFEYSINTPENFDADQYKIPSLLLQPYVENSIKHGLLHKIGAKNLTISFEVKKDTLIITIKDNGIGRKKSEELKKLRKNPHQSFATEAMEQKIQLLNKNKLNKITLEIIDEHTVQNNAKGTTVIFKIPLDFNYK